MTSLTIERLHARYDGVGPATAAQLDGVLMSVAGEHLDARLLAADLNQPGLAAAWAVCIDAITFEISLNPAASRAALGEVWARGIIEAINRAMAGGDGAPGVVVYRTEGDAVLDVLRGVAARDLRRVWAWRQAGLVPRRSGPPTPSDMAALLSGRPALAPGALRVADAAARAVLDPAGWIAVACAVRNALRFVISPSTTSQPQHPPTGEDRTWAQPNGAASDRRELREPAEMAAENAAEMAAAMVPAAVWQAAGDADRTALANLALLAKRPHLAHHHAIVHKVIDVAHRVAARGSSRTAIDQRRLAGLDTAEPSPTAGATREVAAPPGPFEPAEQFEPAHPNEIFSRWAGVWLLLRPLLDLQLVERLAGGTPDPRLALAQLVHRLTGVPIDDPAVAVLCGTGEELHRAVDDAEVAGAVELVRAWLADRFEVGEPRAGAPDPAALWQRPGTVVNAPASIEVCFALDSADVAVRRAGLDLDPGFVWWLGAVVRFRYG